MALSAHRVRLHHKPLTPEIPLRPTVKNLYIYESEKLKPLHVQRFYMTSLHRVCVRRTHLVRNNGRIARHAEHFLGQISDYCFPGNNNRDSYEFWTLMH